MQPKVIISECTVFPIFDFFAYLFFPVVEEKSRKMLPLQSPPSGPHAFAPLRTCCRETEQPPWWASETQKPTSSCRSHSGSLG